jgi:hypothetical protein
MINNNLPALQFSASWILIKLQYSLLLLSVIALSACTSSPPKNPDNICSTFVEKRDWLKSTRKTHEKWGTPIPVQMAIIYQESRFVADAQPPRTRLLGFIPWFRPTSAYGYPQALDGTWDDYKKHTGRLFASRSNFADATDFVGWYNHISHTRLGIPLGDAKQLYLAYHEGHGGFKRKTYLRKKWLLNVADKVAGRSQMYHKQMSRCQNDLKGTSWFF